MLLYSQLHAHLPHPLHSLSFHRFTQSQTIPEPSQESHVACMQGAQGALFLLIPAKARVTL